MTEASETARTSIDELVEHTLVRRCAYALSPGDA
jgi:hypothetical protein